MTKPLILILLFMSFSSTIYANDVFNPKWKATCNCGGNVFYLSFIPKSMDPKEDDMLVKLIAPGGKELTLPLEQDLYQKRAIVSDEKNICDVIGGIRLSDSQVLLWVSRDDRPRWDQLSLVLLDLKEIKILDVKENIGPIKDPTGNTKMAIRKKNNGFEIRLEKEWLKNTGEDCPENSIEGWMYIKVVDNKINYKWSD